MQIELIATTLQTESIVTETAITLALTEHPHFVIVTGVTTTEQVQLLVETTTHKIIHTHLLLEQEATTPNQEENTPLLKEHILQAATALEMKTILLLRDQTLLQIAEAVDHQAEAIEEVAECSHYLYFLQ